jgi:hypothetical protein
VRERDQHVLEMFGTRSARFSGRIVARGQLQVRRRQQLHAHRRQLGRFVRDVPLPHIRLQVRREIMERVSRFVHQRAHVVRHADAFMKMNGMPPRSFVQ